MIICDRCDARAQLAPKMVAERSIPAGWGCRGPHTYCPACVKLITAEAQRN